MLKNRARLVERIAAENRRQRQLVQDYGDFLRTLFGPGDWFVTLTFRDKHQDTGLDSTNSDNHRDRSN
jgi:hypothetical protein